MTRKEFLKATFGSAVLGSIGDVRASTSDSQQGGPSSASAAEAAKAKNFPAGTTKAVVDFISNASFDRMGTDPRRSALTAFNQMHEVKNVFVVDGSAFPTATEKNPTLTILSLSWRATDYLAQEMKRGNL